MHKNVVLDLQHYHSDMLRNGTVISLLVTYEYIIFSFVKNQSFEIQFSKNYIRLCNLKTIKSISRRKAQLSFCKFLFDYNNDNIIHNTIENKWSYV